MIDGSDGRQLPCSICGELHELSMAERFFIDECERRGLPWQCDVMPVTAQRIAALASLMVAPIGMSLDDDPGMLPYYAAALVAISRVADHQAEVKVAAECEDVGDVPPDAAWRM